MATLFSQLDQQRIFKKAAALRDIPLDDWMTAHEQQYKDLDRLMAHKGILFQLQAFNHM
jgi:hypothetical protein